MSTISNRPSSKLTSTMLTQIEENEYLRVKLIQLEKISREKDNFYLSIFREQQKITEKVMSELLLAESKIKQFVRQRICNNWKDEYDNLADNINSYITDVNGLIEQYRLTKKELQEKAYQNNDLYDYYSNTLEECGKKFDQAQVIIEELNDKIDDLKLTIIELDEDLGQKMSIIEEQRDQIEALHQEINDHQVLRESHESNIKTSESLRRTIKKQEKDNQALERSNQQLGRLVNELRRQQDEDIAKRQALEQDVAKLQHSIDALNQQIKQSQKSREKEQAAHKKSQQSKIFRKGDLQLLAMFDSNSKPISPEEMDDEQKLFNEKQLHLKKILEQQETIQGLATQLNYNKRSIEVLESQNNRLVQFQIQYMNMENSYKRQFSQLKQKIISLNQQIQHKSQQINGLYSERAQLKNQDEQIKIEQEGLHAETNQLKKKLDMFIKENDFLMKANQQNEENISQLQRQKQQTQGQFETLLQEFQQFVKESDYQKQLEAQNRKQALTICSFQVDQSFTIFKNKLVSTPSFSQKAKMKKKNLLINLDDHQRLKQREDPNMQISKEADQSGTTKSKKFSLQTFQQKTNPQINICWSPKVGDIYNALHQGRSHPTHHW